MKKLLLALSVSMAFSSATMAEVVASQDALDEGRVTFSGKIVPQTCVVEAGSKAKSVELPTLSLASLTGQNRGNTPFEIVLTECQVPVGNTQISLGFKPAETDVHAPTGALLNKAVTTPAKNVGVQILSKNTPIKLQKPVGEQGVASLTSSYQPTDANVDTGEFDYTFHFSAEYVVTGDSATAGDVQVVLPFSIIYK